MATQQKKQKKVITPFRISIAANILLSLVIISALSASTWAYYQYKNGTQRAAGFALLHRDAYCEMHSRNIDKWLQESADQDWGTPEDIKRQKLAVNMMCVTEDFEPYMQEAAEAYFKANGLKLMD